MVLREGVPLYLDNASADPRSVGLPDGHPPIGALTGIPLLSRSGILGGLFVANKQGGGTFTEDDNDFLMMLSLQAVTAIENARLYNKTVELAAKDGPYRPCQPQGLYGTAQHRDLPLKAI